MEDPSEQNGGGAAVPPAAPAENSTPLIPSPAPAPDPIHPATSASQSPSTPRSGLYVPQFSAATQMILKRMKTEAAGLSSALSGVKSSQLEVKSEFKPSTYEEVKRRVIEGMNTTSMTLQMPPAPRSTPGRTPVPEEPQTYAPSLQGGFHTSAPAARAKMANGAAGLSAIRRVTLGLTASGRPIALKQPHTSTTAVEPKEKKARAPWGSKTGTKRKRGAPRAQDDDASSLSSLSDASGDEEETSSKPATPSAPPILTKSGRHVLKPTTYNPAEMESSSAKKRTTYSKARTAEQALCKKCTRMHSPTSNQIVFCDECNEGWHQMCHEPWIDDVAVKDTNKAWFCATCQSKRDGQYANTSSNTVNHPPKRQKIVVPPVKESWADRTPQQKRAFLSTLPQQELVGLLMYSLEIVPDLPIFPGSPDTTLSTPSTPQTPSDLQPTTNGRKGNRRAYKGGKGIPLPQQRRQFDNDEEFDPLGPPWPKPGHGLYSMLPPEEDDEFLADDGDFEAFSVIVYDDRGRKVEENGVKVVVRA